jgi:hypothetical protein
MNALLKIGLTFLLVALATAYYSDLPVYRIHDDGETELKLVVRHSGTLLEACRTLSTSELDQLAPNMRKPTSCPREKSPMTIELTINELPPYVATIVPSGLHNDGVLALYKSFNLKHGPVRIRLRSKEDSHQQAFAPRFDQVIEADHSSIVVLELDDAGVRAHQPGHSS